jgi:pilus assembly protein CpaE
VADVSAITPNETARSWKATSREQSVHLFVSGIDGDAAALVGQRVAGFPLALTIVSSGDAIDPHALSGAAAAVVQIDQDNPDSMRRFQQLAQETDLPLIAAAYEPPLALVRSLNRAGAYDVIPLPLSLEELETALAPLREDLSKRQAITDVGKGKLVTIVKSEGGVGASPRMKRPTIARHV